MSEHGVLKYLRSDGGTDYSFELYRQLSDRTWEYVEAWYSYEYAVAGAPDYLENASYWCIVDRNKGKVVHEHPPATFVLGETVFLSGKFSEEPVTNRIKDVTRETPLPNWTGGVKYDSSKLDFTLLPWESLEEVVRVLEYGAKKYARDNWRLISAERYEAAGLRHRVARLRGEENDPESGFSHLAHEACCLLFQIALRDAPAEVEVEPVRYYVECFSNRQAKWVGGTGAYSTKDAATTRAMDIRDERGVLTRVVGSDKKVYFGSVT
jgi:hypothetical protein